MGTADIQQVRTISKVPTFGKDVEALTRAQFRYFEDWPGLAAFHARSDLVRRTYDPWDRDRTKAIQKIEGLPQTGAIGPYTFGVLLDHFDMRARALYLEYARSLKPKPAPLVEPNQGWGSLHRVLWPAYSEGRRRALSDLGTYNPDSLLPSGAPSDHAVLPAMAFDLGIEPDTGWQNLKARGYAIWTSGRGEVEYTILGNRIWSGRFRFWGRYRFGGHLNHVHVSGWR